MRPKQTPMRALCASVLALAAAPAAAETYLYDALGRLLVVVRDDGSQSTYTYDPADNRLTLVLAGASGGGCSAGVSLQGQSGGSNLSGGPGNDTLTGGVTGPDTMTGGACADRFAFPTVPYQPATVTDFTVGTDKIDVSA